MRVSPCTSPTLCTSLPASTLGPCQPNFSTLGPVAAGLALLLMISLGACGNSGNSKTTPATGDSSSSDDTDAIVFGTDASEDTDSGIDTGSSDTTSGDIAQDISEDTGLPSNCPGAAGCPCASVDQCDSGFCIQTPSGMKCAAVCNGPCPDSTYKCVTAPTNDSINICVPRYGNVCNPCTKNEECISTGNGGAHCVAFGNAGSFCGLQCALPDDCPSGYDCSDVPDVTGQTVKQCVVKNGGACTCTDAAMQLELSTKCYNTGAGDAKCEGKRTCKVGTGLSACISEAPAPETCNGKDDNCDGQTDEGTCDDGIACTDDSCAGVEGCKHLNNTKPCDADNSKCTVGDVCASGKCVAGAPLTCDDGNVCTLDSCDPAQGCIFTNNDGQKCDADSTDCTVADSCKGGQCAAGPAKACASDDPCIDAKCDKASGACKYPSKVGLPCEDGNPCTVGDVCGGVGGDQCLPGPTQGACDDKNDCTEDSCNAKIGCQHTPKPGAICNDGNACTLGEFCSDSAICSNGKAFPCDDLNPCTSDLCDPLTGCKHTPLENIACEDGNPCTAGDLCTAGICKSGANNCSCATDGDCKGGNLCTGLLFCDKTKQPFTCQINPLSKVNCDQSLNNDCQTNSCDGQKGCILNKKPDGFACDADGNVCTVGDACSGGYCMPGAKDTCDDSNPCTTDSCDTKGGCSHVNNTSPCDADGDACTAGDACVGGNCLAGALANCDDQEGCTKDSCDKVSGQCSHQDLQASCSDGNACTAGDACGLGANQKWTCTPGKASACDDANPCTTDTCDVLKGCSNVVSGNASVPCYSGDPATQGKGICKAGTASCGADGKAGACVGDVTPQASDPCDGLDNNCDGITDPGCQPKGFTASFASADVSGTTSGLTLRSLVGHGTYAGPVSNGVAKYSVNVGFFSWIKAYLGL